MHPGQAGPTHWFNENGYGRTSAGHGARPYCLHNLANSPIRTFFSRNKFTEIEDLYLTQYIARRIPLKASGGRTGQKIYRDLVSLVCSTKLGVSYSAEHNIG
jgi:hypothetical protein